MHAIQRGKKENSLYKFIRDEMAFFKKYHPWWPLGNSSHLSLWPESNLTIQYLSG